MTDRSDTVTEDAVHTDEEMRNEPVGSATSSMDGNATLFGDEEATRFRTRWESIQAEFVDDPKAAVEHADELVSAVTDRIVQSFQDGRSTLEQAWSSGDEVSTETLRTTLQRYRTYFNRLLNLG
jgi:hypothetical protein